MNLLRNSEKSVSLNSEPTQDSAFVFTSSGVLNLVNEKVTIDIKADADTVVWGIGNSDDVKAYVGDSAAVEIAGFESWDETKLKKHDGKQETIAGDKERGAKGEFDISQSDLWVKSGKAENKAQIEFNAPQGLNRSLVVSTLSGKAPEVTLTWTQTQSNSAIPWLIIGILVALIGGFLLLGDNQDRARLKAIRERQMLRREQKLQFAQAQTSVIPAFKGDLASPETDREIQIKHTDRALGATIVPGTSRAQTWRSRELHPDDRIVLPVQTPESHETELALDANDQHNNADSDAPPLEDDVTKAHESENREQEKAQNSAEDDIAKKSEYWKSLWTFANGSENEKGGANNG